MTERMRGADISAAVDDLGWRYVLGLVRTAVPVESLAAAADAASRVATAAGDDAAGHVWLDVRPDRLIVSVQTRSIGWVTTTDVDVVRRITAEGGVLPDVRGGRADPRAGPPAVRPALRPRRRRRARPQQARRGLPQQEVHDAVRLPPEGLLTDRRQGSVGVMVERHNGVSRVDVSSRSPDSVRNPSVNSIRFGASIAVNSHQPGAFSPSGPVM